ncbi:unnamed protein product [Phytophthora fragariaefolia]|uniref:Unnamed protein product n=1 Tax=Phytophthora fragariaefolia TaxID=1490495 RepID=A0A9W6TSV8_9STRA|nr:unnamed protein product [Phytophthora fragariaefolia]
MILDISSGESRGYWKYHVPDKKFKQAKAVGKINNAKATLLFDSGAEVSILDTAFARNVGCHVDNSQTLQCEGVGKSPYMAEGRTRLKITLAGSLVYFFDAWVGPPTGGQDLILGMDFMVPAGIRLDLADGTICLPAEIDMGGSEEVRLRTGPSDRQKLSVTRGDRWVPTYVAGPGQSCYLCLTNVSERKLILHGDTKIAMWLTGDRVPRLPGYVSVGSRRYAEWQNLAYQVTTDENGVIPKQEEVQGPAVERPLYQTPTSILKRPPGCTVGTAGARQINDQGFGIDSLHSIQDSLYNIQGLPPPSGEASCTQTTTARVRGATNEAGICSAHVIHNQGQGALDPDRWLNTSANRWREQRVVERSPNPDGLSDFLGEHKHIPANGATSTHSGSVDLGDRAIDLGNEEVCIKGSGDLYAEDVEGHRDNALYGFLKITKRQDHQARNAGGQGRQRPIDLFQDGKPDTDKESFVLGRRSYIDDTLVTTGSWDMLCERVDKLLDACDEWNLSISVAKSVWGLKKVDYLGHRIWAGGMEARPKDLSSLVDLPFPTSLRSVIGTAQGVGCVLHAISDKIDQGSNRHSTSAWMLNSSGLQGRLGRLATLLSNWTLEIVKCTKGEDEILGVIAASITPLENVDSILTSIAPRKQPRQVISMPPPTVESDKELLVVSFDGSARVKRGGGAFSAIVWSLPDWTVISGASEYKTNLTVNEAEYHGLLLCFDLLAKQYVNRKRLIICGDSNLVIRQMRGEIECKTRSLKLLRHKAMEKLRSWPNHKFLHVKRDWNQSADKLASAALQREAGKQVTSQIDIDNLATLNRLAELLVPLSPISVVKIAAITWPRQRRDWDVLQEPLVQRMRMERIGRAQDEEKLIGDLKKYLTGDVRELTSTEAKSCAKIAEDYDIDEVGLLFYCPPSKQSCKDCDLVTRLVIPETLQEGVLHHYHTSLEGGHQDIGRTYQRIRAHFHWRGLYRSVQQYVGQCVDCETGKGRPTMEGESPGNLQATYPLQIIAMDHIPSLPNYKGNTELLIWIDLFTGYVIAQASGSRITQAIAENYEECVFRRFGASEVIRHDREPGFMSDFFRSFNKIVGQKQRATMAYRPQANGTAERMVQTLTRSRDYQHARETVNERLRDAIQSQGNRHNESIHPYEIEVGMQVWLYLDRVKEGYARKLAHMWHGPFRVAAVIDTHAVRLEIARTEYRLFPIVHTSKLKPVRNFPDRPKVPLVIEDQNRFDFDEALLPEDSWDTSLAEGEYELERITDMISGR